MGNRAGPLRASCSLCWLLQGREGQASPWKWTCGPLKSSWINRGAYCSHSPTQLWWVVTGSQQVLSAGPQGRTISSGRQKDVWFSLCLPLPHPVSVPLSLSLSLPPLLQRGASGLDPPRQP